MQTITLDHVKKLETKAHAAPNRPAGSPEPRKESPADRAEHRRPSSLKAARSALYRLAGEQSRRADLIRARDEKNRQANAAEAAANKAEREAEAATREADGLARAETEADATEAVKINEKREGLYKRAVSLRAFALSQRCAIGPLRESAAKLTAQIGKLPRGSRAVRREAMRAASRVRRAARREQSAPPVQPPIDVAEAIRANP